MMGEDKHWITDDAYRKGLALIQFAPGPLAAPWGIYPGFVPYRLLGGTLGGAPRA
jgi:chromate transporter